MRRIMVVVLTKLWWKSDFEHLSWSLHVDILGSILILCCCNSVIMMAAGPCLELNLELPCYGVYYFSFFAAGPKLGMGMPSFAAVLCHQASDLVLMLLYFFHSADVA
ncbi:hypothetical protein U1Q18_025732 [Sarracenia purpurea var. burkii]